MGGGWWVGELLCGFGVQPGRPPSRTSGSERRSDASPWARTGWVNHKEAGAWPQARMALVGRPDDRGDCGRWRELSESPPRTPPSSVNEGDVVSPVVCCPRHLQF